MSESVDTRDGTIHADVTLGDPGSDDAAPDIGTDPTIRSGAIIYGSVTIGDGFTTGHDVLIREDTTIGDRVLVGTKTVIDGMTTVGDDVSLQTDVYVPSHTTIEDRVFVGPSATLTNDPYPLRQDADLAGPTLEADVSIGANATILPDVTVGEGAFVAAGAVVTEDVPPNTLAVGAPSRIDELPEELQGGNGHR